MSLKVNKVFHVLLGKKSDAMRDSDAETLVRARGEFRRGNYREALDTLQRFSSNSEISEVWELSARCNHFLRNFPVEATCWRIAETLTGDRAFKMCEVDALIRAGSLHEAERILLALESTSPSNAEILEKLGEVCRNSGSLSRAHDYSARSIKALGSTLSSHLKYASIATEVGELGAALQALADARLKFGENSLFVEAEARIARASGDSSRALALINSAIELDGDNLNFLLARGYFYLDFSNYSSALQDASTVLEHEPQNIAGLELLTAAQRKLNAIDDAERTAQLLNDERNKQGVDARAYRKNVQASGEAQYAELIEAVRRDPSNIIAIRLLLDRSKKLGRVKAVYGWIERLKLCQGFSAQDALLCGRALFDLDEKQASEDHLWSFLNEYRKNLQYVKLCLEVSRDLEHQGRAVEAARAVLEVLRSSENMAENRDVLNSDLEIAYQDLVWLHFNAADLNSADLVLDEFQSRFPDHSFALELKAAIAIDRRDFPSALAWVAKYRALYPRYGRGPLMELTSLLGCDRRSEAAKYLEDADGLDVLPQNERDQVRSFARAIVDLRVAERDSSPAIVLDITSLSKVIAEGASPGGIERTIIEVALNLLSDQSINLKLVVWKTIPVEIEAAAFIVAVSSRSAISGNPSLRGIATRELCEGDKLFHFIPGDAVLILGSAWHYDAINAIMAEYNRVGVKTGLYIHDLLQLYYPSLVSEKWASIFRRWIGGALDFADVLMVNSDHSGREIDQFLQETGRAKKKWQKVELGDDYRKVAVIEDKLAVQVKELVSPASAQQYVLYVSAVGKRKNHIRLLEVWSRLASLLQGQCPILVLVGAAGDSYSEVRTFLEKTNFCNGTVKHLRNVSDNDLDVLYKSSLFTVFPSICEGWGLPIAEALTRGKVCLASKTTSMPEVGGDWADYFDPFNADELLELLYSYIKSPSKVATREREITEGYTPRTWKATAKAILNVVDPVRSFSKTNVYTREKKTGVIQICATWGKECGIASYTNHVAQSLSSSGRENVIFRGVDDALSLLQTGRFEHVLVQHEYGLYDNFNPNLAGPDSTEHLLQQLGLYAQLFPNTQQSIIMHTMDMQKHELRSRTLDILSSKLPIFTLSSEAARRTRAIFLEHGVLESENLAELKITDRSKLDGRRLKVASFGFLSPHKRVDQFLEACRNASADVVANFASNSQSLTHETERLFKESEVGGRITFQFQSDSDLQKLLREGDVVYFPQGPISYWATTGSARVAMNANRPVITSIEDQFEDLAPGAIFSSESELPFVLERLKNEEYYNIALSNLQDFRRRFSIKNVYENMFKISACGSGSTALLARHPVDIVEIIAMEPEGWYNVIFSSFFGREPDKQEVWVPSTTILDKLDVALSLAEMAIKEGYDIDVRAENIMPETLLKHSFSKVDSQRLISLLPIMTIGWSFAQLSIAKCSAHSLAGDDVSATDHVRLVDLSRLLAQQVNKTVSDNLLDSTVYLTTKPPVPSRIQYARRHYNICEFFAFDTDLLPIAVYRAIAKRDPSLSEYFEFIKTDWPNRQKKIIEMANAYQIKLAQPEINIERMIEDTKAAKDALRLLADTCGHEIIGDNKAKLARVRLSREFEAFAIDPYEFKG